MTRSAITVCPSLVLRKYVGVVIWGVVFGHGVVVLDVVLVKGIDV
jgi:hypothetical protein